MDEEDADSATSLGLALCFMRVFVEIRKGQGQ
jgi:hypothetical protein